MPKPKHRRRLWLLLLPAVLLVLFLLNLALQTFWAHREPYFVPDYPRLDLTGMLSAGELTDSEYEALFLQTGLSHSAVDDFLAYGGWGVDRILETQDGIFNPPAVECTTLIGGRFTCEDRLRDENGGTAWAVPLAPLKPGDILVSFSTHTFGWRHGHAGLVVDAGEGITLEAVQMFSDSAQMKAGHWPSYSNFMILRVWDATEEQRETVARFALDNLDRTPYNLVSGIFGPKAPAPNGHISAQCAYLPWYAWQALGFDLDGNGGRIVTVGDLASSPLVDVVQVYGIDPARVQ